MDDLIDNLNKKIIEVNNKLNNLKENYNLNKKNSKKILLLNIKLNEYFESINDVLEEFESNEIDEYVMNKELDQRMYNNESIKEIINIFGPYILLYQISKNTL
jgi:hypothetical protein